MDGKTSEIALGVRVARNKKQLFNTSFRTPCIYMCFSFWSYTVMNLKISFQIFYLFIYFLFYLRCTCTYSSKVC